MNKYLQLIPWFKVNTKQNSIELKIKIASLEQCAAQSTSFLARYGIKVEIGGVLIGTFDGSLIQVRRFLLDENAQCSPASIHLSADIFRLAENEVRQNNEGRTKERWFIVGTWHTHPSGVDSFSSTDETMLFRDRMRILTDDPSMALAPWVHLIFPGYTVKNDSMRVFTMQLKSTYELIYARGNRQIDKLLLEAVDSHSNIGLILSKPEEDELLIDRYHPDIFKLHHQGIMMIRGLWKCYNFWKIATTFENIFLENFFQKTELSDFLYVRLLRKNDMDGPNLGWFRCVRYGNYDIANIADFKEIKLHLESEGLDGN